MDVAAWISAVAAALSALFTVLTWHRSNLSKAAREAAEKSEKEATRKVDAAEKQADELRRLVESLSLPPLVADAEKIKGGLRAWLRNTTNEPIVVDAVLNHDAFLRLDVEEHDVPFTLAGGAQATVLAHEAMGAPVPSNLHLRLGDGTDVYVPLQPR